MSAIVLVDALEALLPTDLAVYDADVVPSQRDEVPESALPWVVTSVALPDTIARSVAGTSQAGVVQLRTTIAGLTTDSVTVIYDRLHAALDRARPAVPGWRCSPLQQVRILPITPDRDVRVIKSNAHPLFTVAVWETTVSRAS